MTDAELLTLANRRLLAKALAESCFEGSLEAIAREDGFLVALADAVHYRFRATRGLWDWLVIEPDSITRNGVPAHSPQQFLLDAQTSFGIDDILLGNLLAELNNTLYSDVQTLKRQQRWTALELSTLDGITLQSLLDGHPKLLASKGRIGWGINELARYSPEAGEPIELRWLGVRIQDCTSAISEVDDWQALWQASLSAEDLDYVRQCLAQQNLSLKEVRLLPVHPWQWQHHIAIQYAESLASSALIDFGELQGDYRAQLSLRTLSGPGDADIKLALTILNTSCFRGIPGRYIAIGPILSDWLTRLTQNDPELSPLIVQRELAGIHCPAPWQQALSGTPYRYQEMLGAIWRESLEARLKDDQLSRPLAAFMHSDMAGDSLIGAHIRQSGLSVETWLRRLFEVTAVPLYHLMCAYGVGVIAHGQNLTVILERHAPVAGAIKDFHGDLRLWEEPLAVKAGLPQVAAKALTHLPAHYLIHDLVTGYLITTLRFISPLVARDLDYPESAFYPLLGETLLTYQRRHPHLAKSFVQFDLFTPRLLRVCINRARYRVGYDDSAERPLPELGPPLDNPLMLAQRPAIQTIK
ncbi:IucA/IucC family siderophore biosynthesis protein [Halomonas sp. PR-M31]|uniref:IucA/IucC family protein n=1 Tax=Halomonas sp. PR-M31 TaxID=1471202 RepID=UPI00065184B9|nr:IucA/IucC family protein [Halomonas sp. PR-M31]